MKTLIILSLSIIITLASSVFSQSKYEGYYLFLGDYPSNTSTPEWQSDRTQGITHDDNFWYITSRKVLWKIPVSHDLKEKVSGKPGVERRNMNDISTLINAGYDHFGDLDHYKYKGQDYLLIPTMGSGDPILAVFKSDLAFVGYSVIPGIGGAGWCAVDPDGFFYSSNNTTSSINKYIIDWELIKNDGQVVFDEKIETYNLLDETGAVLKLNDMQGGEFSESGEILYLSCGLVPWSKPNDGINVFESSNWQRIQASTNGYGYFNYEFDNSLNALNEPEGLTVWDLDDGRAPNIRGQLHVLLYDHDWGVWPLDGDDEVEIKHYSNTIHVDANKPSYWPQNGRSFFPFQTLGDAVNFFPIWDGAVIKVATGNYPENVTINKHVNITPINGPIRIGN